MSTGKLHLLFFMFAGLTASAFDQGTNSRTQDFSFPPTGLGSTETLEVNLTNLASNSQSGTAASCTGTVTFINSTGATIGTASPFTLTTGQSTTVSLLFSKAGITGIRGIVRAKVEVTLTASVPCQLSASLDSYDSTTGATHFFSGGPSIAAIVPLEFGH